MILHAHVPKTAGSAFNHRIIYRNYKQEEIFHAYEGVQQDHREGAWTDDVWQTFSRSKVLIGHVAFGFPKIEDDYQFLSVVRDPLDRTISAISFAVIKGGMGLNRLLEEGESAEDIKPDDLISRMMADEETRRNWSNVTARVLSGEFPRPMEEEKWTLSTALSNARRRCYSILINEDFERESEEWCKRYGLQWYSRPSDDLLGGGEPLPAETDEDRLVKKFVRAVKKEDLGAESIRKLESINEVDKALYLHLSGMSQDERLGRGSYSVA